MISIINDLPENVVGVKATGEITKADFDNVLMPAVNALAKRTDKINYLLLLETDISKFEIGAWVKDMAMGFKHLFKWDKVAIVTDQKGVEKFTDVFSYAVPGEYKGFSIAELDAAKAWVSAPEVV